MTDRELFILANEAKENAYAPYSKFKVGAALLAKSGKLYTGANMENATYGATICAERTAFVKALSEGEREFIKIAVAAEATEAFPCGICRQFMYEFGGDIEVIVGIDAEHLQKFTVDELLPHGFRLERDKE